MKIVARMTPGRGIQRNAIVVTQGPSRLLGLTILLVLSFGSNAPAQSATDSLRDATAPLKHPGLRSQCTASDTLSSNALLGLLKAIADEQEAQRKLTFEVGAALSSDDADGGGSLNAAENHRADVSLALRRGSYPGELGFATNFGVSLADGRFSENISQLHVSYDHYIGPQVQPFVFLNRLSDQFLSIDQRYEVGSGIVIDVHPFRVYKSDEQTPSGRDRLRKISADSLLDDRYVLTWMNCLQKAYAVASGGTNFAKDSLLIRGLLERVRKERRRVSDGVRKTTSWLRAAMLFEVIAELERATIAVKDAAGNELATPVPGRRTYRWAIRPTIVLRPFEALTIRADYYYKHAFAGFRAAADGSSDFRRDVRVAVIADGSASGAGRLTATLEFQRLFDNAPPFAGGPSGVVVARDRHDRIALRLGAKF